VNLRKITVLAAGILLAAVIIVLLIWPEMAGTVTMGLLLLAAVQALAEALLEEKEIGYRKARKIISDAMNIEMSYSNNPPDPRK
jgi:hypothetical protein